MPRAPPLRYVGPGDRAGPLRALVARVAEARAVTTGLANKTQVEILSGLKAGEEVVTAGQVNLEDGVKVDVVPEL